jgi:N-methylhydantoinase B/oxoprolinase/acetone carboxylase alpha subunit
LPPKLAGLRIQRGDTVTVVTPGAGGYGAPDGDDRQPPAAGSGQPRAR